MKKFYITFLFLIAYISSVSAQITREQADEIVFNCMSDETKSHIIFAKEDVQIDGFIVITDTGEELNIVSNYLVEITFEEYFLSDGLCVWTNLSHLPNISFILCPKLSKIPPRY
jgi:hypothetical protein